MRPAESRAATALWAVGWWAEDEVVVGVGLEGEGLAALLGFEDEVAALVEVDETAGDGAVEIADFNGLVEDVGVEVLDAGGGIGAFDFEEVAKLGEEELIVGAFGGVGLLPARKEVRADRRHGRS